MELKNYYLHATGGYKGLKNDENKIIQILDAGKVKSTEETKNYHKSPKNKVCLCDPTKPIVYDPIYHVELLSSFKGFVLCSPSLVFSRNLQVETPEYKLYTFYENESDMYDEVRYNGELSLEQLEFITFPLWPIHKLTVELTNSTKLRYLEMFKQNLQVISKQYQIETKDIYTGNTITVDDIDKHIKIYQKEVRG